MNTFYEFKINLSEEVINSSNINKEKLIGSVLPRILTKVFKNNERINNDLIKFDINEKYKSEISDDLLYIQLKNLTEELTIEYNKITKGFYETGDIFYPSEFRKLLDKCTDIRNELETVYPELKDYISNQTGKNVDYNFINVDYDFKVGTGVTHFKRFYHIEKFLTKNVRVNLIYSIAKETFYINEITYKFKEAQEILKDVESIMNRNEIFINELKSATIIPRYDKIQLSNKATKIKMVISFPNDDLIEDLKDELGLEDLTEKSSSKRMTVEFDGDNLNINAVEQSAQTIGEKGHLLEIVSKGKKMVPKVSVLSISNLGEKNDN